MSPLLVILCSLFTITTAQDPSLGDPNFLASYPPCAAQCQIQVVQSRTVNPCAFTTTNNLTCQCDSGNRAATAACEKVACSPAEYDATQNLAQDLCGPLYSNNTLNASPVSAAIASATAAAAAAVAGKDATNTNDYPLCGTACQQQYIPQSGCGSLANKSCICNNPVTVTSVGRCESQTCNPQDRATILYLSYQLCAGVGGIGNASEAANQTVATQTGGSVVLPPTGVPGGVEPFTGGVNGKGLEVGGWIVLMGVFALSWMVL